MFNWFSLDIIYYPVSAIMWFWYKVFGFVLGPDNFFAWGLTVMFLVFTLRAILYKPFVRQIRTTRQMQELQPQIKALQKKYGKDRQRMALEMQKLQKDHGFNPVLGCLPMLAQIPVFIGLYHVLNSFNRTQTGFGRLGLSPEVNAQLGNYVFNAADVQNFLRADLFGAPLGASMIQTVGLGAFEQFDRIAVIIVGVPLMILAGVATHFNSRASVARQSVEASASPQTAMMNKLALYVFPLGVVVGGPFLPLAIILYWVANNIWTYCQQHIVFGRIEKEEETKKQDEMARRASNAPTPGTKPKRKRSSANGAGAQNSVPTQSTTDASGEITAGEAPEDDGAVPAPEAPSTALPSSTGKSAAARVGGHATRSARQANSRPKKRRP